MLNLGMRTRVRRGWRSAGTKKFLKNLVRKSLQRKILRSMAKKKRHWKRNAWNLLLWQKSARLGRRWRYLLVGWIVMQWKRM
ncbi:hypothetical protein CsSME_00003300 [Camellia sinensis var. sinensis]